MVVVSENFYCCIRNWIRFLLTIVDVYKLYLLTYF